MHRLACFVLLACLVVACGAAAPSPSPIPSASPSPPAMTPAPEPASPPAGSDLDAIIGEWVLEQGTLDGQPIPIVPDAPITLSVNAIRIGGTSACNSYGADWIVSQDGTVEIDDVTMTMMLCEGPINDSEQAYIAALGRATSVGLDGDRLVLAGENMELRFVRANG